MSTKKRGKGRWRTMAKKKQKAVDAKRSPTEQLRRAESFVLFLRKETKKQELKIRKLKKARKWPTRPSK